MSHFHDYQPSPSDPRFQICRKARQGCDQPQRMIPARPAPAQEHSETSKDAARSIDGKQRHRDRLIVFGELRKADLDGLTDEELIERSGLGANTARPRRIDLCNERLVEDSGKKRRVKSGREATVWRLSSLGVASAHDTDTSPRTLSTTTVDK